MIKIETNQIDKGLPQWMEEAPLCGDFIFSDETNFRYKVLDREWRYHPELYPGNTHFPKGGWFVYLCLDVYKC